MRRRGSDQGGRWPWEVWFALVGVSAGTVASFAGVGWAFLHAAGLVEETGEAAPLAWDRDEVVIEAEEAPEGGPIAEDTAEPSTTVRWEPEPEAALVGEEATPAEPALERTPEADAVAPQLVPVEPGDPSTEEMALVPIEPPDHTPDGARPSAGGGSASPSLLGLADAR
ncbi:MAG TPA: hypothetical protein VKZ65_08645 [Glycomyces sp.]|nr:hypothetical protein [Glycomyces sp.]